MPLYGIYLSDEDKGGGFQSKIGFSGISSNIFEVYPDGECFFVFLMGFFFACFIYSDLEVIRNSGAVTFLVEDTRTIEVWV